MAAESTGTCPGERAASLAGPDGSAVVRFANAGALAEASAAFGGGLRGLFRIAAQPTGQQVSTHKHAQVTRHAGVMMRWICRHWYGLSTMLCLLAFGRTDPYVLTNQS